MKFALIPGHGPEIDRGAENRDGTTELDWNRDLVNRILFYLQDKTDVVVIHRRKERISPVEEVNASCADVAVEFHLNCASGNATGTEMVYISEKGKALADLLQKEVVSCLKLKDRGVRLPYEGRGHYFLGKTHSVSVIAESFFIDNDSDLRTGNDRKEELAMAYAKALLAYEQANQRTD